MGWPSVSLTLFSLNVPFTIPFMVCIYAGFSLPPASSSSVAVGKGSSVQKLLKLGSVYASLPTPLFLLSPTLALEQN